MTSCEISRVKNAFDNLILIAFLAFFFQENLIISESV